MGGFRGERRGIGVAYVGRGSEDLILGGHLLQVPLQTFVLQGGMLLGSLKAGELGFEILDMLLLSLSEGSLAARWLAFWFGLVLDVGGVM